MHSEVFGRLIAENSNSLHDRDYKMKRLNHECILEVPNAPFIVVQIYSVKKRAGDKRGKKVYKNLSLFSFSNLLIVRY